MEAVFLTSGGAEANESAFKTARFYWKAKGKTGQGQDHRARPGLPRPDAADDERDRDGPRLLEDVRAARARVRPRPDVLSVSISGRQARRDAPARPRRGSWRRRSCARAPTRLRPSSASRSMAPAACSTRPTTTGRSCATICTRHDVLLIADEIITGFCRTGRWFGLSHWNVDAGHPVVRQRGHLRLPAARRHHGDARDQGGHGYGQPRGPLDARVHLLGPSDLLRGRAEEHRDHGARAARERAAAMGERLKAGLDGRARRPAAHRRHPRRQGAARRGGVRRGSRDEEELRAAT